MRSSSTLAMLQVQEALWVLCVFVTSVRLTGAVISCDAPAVKNGCPAIITCYFEENVNQVKKNVKVQYHPADESTFNPDLMVTVADCYWTNSQEFKCSMHEGYRFLGINGELATVEILKASQEHVGKYMCEMVPSDPGNIQPCKFKLQDEPPDEFDEAIKTVFGVALAALLLSGVLCLFFVAFCIVLLRKRRTCSLTKKHREEESTLENQHEESSPSGVQNADTIQLETKTGDKEAETEGAAEVEEKIPFTDFNNTTVETPEGTKESNGYPCSIA